MKRLAFSLIFSAILLCYGYVAKASIVTNGDFENGNDGWYIDDHYNEGVHLFQTSIEEYPLGSDNHVMRIWTPNYWGNDPQNVGTYQENMTFFNETLSFDYWFDGQAGDVFNVIVGSGYAYSNDNLIASFEPTAGQWLHAVVPIDNPLADGTSNNYLMFQLSAAAEPAGTDRVLYIDNVIIPEPATLAFLGLGLATLLAKRK